MRAITYSEAHQNLAAELDRVVNDCDITIITREQAESGVLMSMHDYESLIETAYLSITVLDREGRVVAFAAFEDFPQVSKSKRIVGF